MRHGKVSMTALEWMALSNTYILSEVAVTAMDGNKLLGSWTWPFVADGAAYKRLGVV